jgi:hypothetical protein
MTTAHLVLSFLMFLAAVSMMIAHLVLSFLMFLAAVSMMIAHLVLSIPFVLGSSVHDDSSPYSVRS